MNITDPVWGAATVDEPVLQELIASRPVQRLKGIHQAGASFYILPEQRSVTRYEHSIGVLLLLRGLGASLEEQVAGLLHDVPHTAFSHTVDIVFPNDEHNFHEQFQHEIIMSSEIPAILERYGLSLRAALEPDRYPLLEQPLPDLCADRLDYTLRDMVALHEIESGEITAFLGQLLPTESGIVSRSIEAALWFAKLFVRANSELYTAISDAGAYWALAGAIRRAYKVGAFTDEHLFSSDEEAMARLVGSGDPVVQAYLDLLRPGTEYRKVDGDGAPFFSTRMKQRIVDPQVLEPGSPRPRRLSELCGEYAEILVGLDPDRVVHYRLWPTSLPSGLADIVGEAV
jgi:HD superfamily phosphohydrolase